MRSPTTGKPFAVRTLTGTRWTGAVELIPSKLGEPTRWKKPQRVFTNSLSDLFHESLPDHAIAQVFAAMEGTRRHSFLILTKRPERMRRWVTEWKAKIDSMADSPAPAGGLYMERYSHIWLGVSVEDQATARARIPVLEQVPAAVRFISYEPALGPIDFTDGPLDPESTMGEWSLLDQLDWVIVGGESGPGARPFDVAWARSTVAQCKAAGVPVFYKQGGASNRCEHSSKGGHLECFPPELQIREFPQ
jgi:protein gp37